MARTDQIFALRLPAELRKEAEKSARIHRRSMTAELLLRLEQGLSLGDLYPIEHAPRVVRIKGGAEVKEPDHPQYVSPELERQLIESFRRLPNDKKKALLTLLQGE